MRDKGILFLLGLGVVLQAVFWPCPAAGARQERLRLATTTSLENSGLLYTLLPYFEKEFGLSIDLIAVGTGKALKLAENGDVDAVLVHAPRAEREFIGQGFGLDRTVIMFNHFVLAGPTSDPAGVKGQEIIPALQRIAAEKAYFVSRGDDSGTDKREKQLWARTGITPEGDWYLETGQGMAQTLRVASEKRAYCLVDAGTFFSYKENLDLEIVCRRPDELLRNIYSIIAVNPRRYPYVKYARVKELSAWLVSPFAAKVIANFRKGGRQLFYPVER